MQLQLPIFSLCVNNSVLFLTPPDLQSISTYQKSTPQPVMVPIPNPWLLLRVGGHPTTASMELKPAVSPGSLIFEFGFVLCCCRSRKKCFPFFYCQQMRMLREETRLELFKRWRVLPNSHAVSPEGLLHVDAQGLVESNTTFEHK